MDALASWSFQFPPAMVASFSARLATREVRSMVRYHETKGRTVHGVTYNPHPHQQALGATSAPDIVALLATLAGLGGQADPLAMEAVQVWKHQSVNFEVE